MDVSFASLEDDDEFSTFECWDGVAPLPWVAEVHNYVRGWVLRQEPFVLAFREDQELVAVSAFRPSSIDLPLAEPISRDAWHLAVVGVRLQHQGQGLCQSVIEETFSRMREQDPARSLVTAFIHEDNGPSLRACARAGLIELHRRMTPFVLTVAEI